MQLNEIIEENTLSAISRKTRLSIENLEKLFANDFSGIQKVQALGFISILEREYRADLSDLREACYAYFSGEVVEEAPKRSYEAHLNPPHKPSSVVDISMSQKSSSFFKPIVVALVVAGLLFAAWQTFSTSMQTDDANGSRSGGDVGFFASMLNQATAWMGGGENSADTFGVDSEGDSQETGTNAHEANASDNSFVITDTSQETQAEDANDIIQKVKEEQARKLEEQRRAAADDQMQNIGDAIASAVEDNGSNDEPLATEVPSIIDASQKVVGETNVVKEVTQAERQAAEEARAREEAAAQQAAEEEAARQVAAEEEALRERAARKKAAKEQAAREKAAREKAAREKAAKAKIIVLKPRKKAWLGIVDLTNMKRRVATSKAPQTFDTSKGRWIVATGHGYLDFTIGSKQMKISDGKQHFLLIQKGKVKEIPHKQFQKLNKSKVW